MHGSARAFLLDAMNELLAATDTPGGPPLRARALFRTACTHAAETAMQIVHLLAREAGAIAIFESCPLERAMRDIHAASHHVAMSANNYTALGRIELGLDN